LPSVSFLLIFHAVSRPQAILLRNGTQLRVSSICMHENMPAQTCQADISHSNSFITTATDFYGRNDLDMVRFFSHTLLQAANYQPSFNCRNIRSEFELMWLIGLCRGNGGLTFDEAKSHFTAWALMKSPLLIGTNVRLSPQ
jgi:hypothetical protein